MRKTPGIFAIMAAAGLFAASPAQADDASDKTDALLGNCLGAPADADRAVLRDLCLHAFDGAIKEAQRPEVHGKGMTRLYWAQAASVAGILVLLYVVEEDGFGPKTCRVAQQGWRSWNLIDPAPEPDDPIIKLPIGLSSATAHCQEHWNANP
ncbi:MAG: hypothetical protein R3D99_02255 [Altererythrobacter sp.]